MRIPIIITSTKGKTSEQLYSEIDEALKKFKKAKKATEKKLKPEHEK